MLEELSFTHLYTRRGTASDEEMHAYELLRGVDGDFTVYSYSCSAGPLDFTLAAQEDEATGRLAGVRLEVLSPCCGKSYWAWDDFDGRWEWSCGGCNERTVATQDIWTGFLVAPELLSDPHWEELYEEGVAAEVVEAWLGELGLVEPLEAIVLARELVAALTQKIESAALGELAESARPLAPWASALAPLL